MSIESVKSAIERAEKGGKTGVILMVDEVRPLLERIDSIQSIKHKMRRAFNDHQLEDLDELIDDLGKEIQ